MPARQAAGFDCYFSFLCYNIAVAGGTANAAPPARNGERNIHMQKMIQFFKKDVVLTASLILAVLSCFLTPPSLSYIGYIDFDTLILLFCLMLVMAGLQEQKFMEFVGSRLLSRTRTRRGLMTALVFLCFISSMFMTNDVSLITFVPFGIMILEMAGLTGSLCLTITLMTIAANLGSMFTPIGNPQNLYLYALSGLSLPEFLLLMGPYTAVSAVLLLLFLFLGYKQARLQVELEHPALKDRRACLLYFVLFFLCILTVAGWLPHVLLLLLTSAALLWKNRRLFVRVDYSLLLTFTFFFLFIGNISGIESFRAWILEILDGRDRILSVLISQVISNVPAAMLLSGYSSHVTELIIGTNIGGLGTLIASMASLISYKQVAAGYPGQKKKYLAVFTFCNLVFLAVLLLLGML